MIDHTKLLLSIYNRLGDTYPLGKVIRRNLPPGRLGGAVATYEAAIQDIFDQIGTALNIPEE